MPRIKVTLTVITLFFPVTATTIGTLGTYRIDNSGLRLVRVLHGCKAH
jgi:hypothetical protein